MTKLETRRDVLKRSRERVQRRRQFRFFSYLSLGLIILVGLGYLVHAPELQIKQLKIEGVTLVPPAAVGEVARAVLLEPGPRLWPRTQSLGYPQKEIARAVAQHFPAFALVSVEREGRQTVRLKITERQPRYLWCPETSSCDYLDATGVVYAPALATTTDLVVWAGERMVSGYGSFLLPPDSFKRLAQILDYLPTVLGPTAAASLPRRVFIRNELTLQVTLEQDNGALWELWLDPRNEAELVWRNLTAVLGSPTFREDMLAGAYIDYIDARFRNKVFYKFK